MTTFLLNEKGASARLHVNDEVAMNLLSDSTRVYMEKKTTPARSGPEYPKGLPFAAKQLRTRRSELQSHPAWIRDFNPKKHPDGRME